MIHYHGTPMGGQRAEVAKFAIGRHFLVPFPRPEDLPVVAEAASSFVFDNGAFSAWRKGNPVTDWSPYYDWCVKWCRHPGFDWAVIPDVIDGSDEDNDALVEEWMAGPAVDGVEGVPVWHLHESLSRLTCLAEEYRVVALGSSGKWATPGTEQWWSRMAEAMGAACNSDGEPNCKLHGLRMMNPAIFTRLPLASADSTNVAQNGNLISRFGMYTPPTLSQRWEVIAQRIERQSSVSTWKPTNECQSTLF